MRLVLDASVAIKFYAAEADSATAVDWLARPVSFTGPDLIFIEVAQALLRHHREKRLSRLQLGDALNDLARLVTAPAPTSPLFSRAIDLAEALTHGLHDCVYLALAEREGHPLLTADETLTAKVRRAGIGVSIVLLSEVPA